MHISTRCVLGLCIGLSLAITAVAAERVVVCEQAYQED